MRIKGVLLASVMVFATVNIGRSLLVDTEQDAEAFHEAFPTKDACLSATAERQARCTSPGCEQLVFSRMNQCLDEADGDKELFCENVEGRWQDSAGLDIFETHCAPHSPYESECQKMIGQVGAYCARLI
jgi:hypothetical protein